MFGMAPAITASTPTRSARHRRDKLGRCRFGRRAFTYDGFRRYVIDRAKVRIAAFLNISCIGLVAWDYELTQLELCDVDLFEMVANQHRDIVCGVKVRMGATTVGTSGIEPVRRSVEAAERCDLPIMVHIAVPPPGIEEFLPLLRPATSSRTASPACR